MGRVQQDLDIHTIRPAIGERMLWHEDVVIVALPPLKTGEHRLAGVVPKTDVGQQVVRHQERAEDRKEDAQHALASRTFRRRHDDAD